MDKLHQINLGWGSFALTSGRLGVGLSKKPLQRVIEFLYRYKWVPTHFAGPLPVNYPAGKIIDIFSTQTEDVKTFIALWTSDGGVIGMAMDENNPACQYEASKDFAVRAIFINQLKPLRYTPTYSGFIESIKIDGFEMLAQPVATCIFQTFWGWDKYLKCSQEDEDTDDSEFDDEFDYATV